MANNWNIPEWLEKKVRSRDKLCVYCRIKLKEYLLTKGTPSDKATFEHIDNDGPNDKEWNIAMCCASCNASKGTKKLMDWLETPHCKENNINEKTVANIIKEFIKNKQK
jgi:5-methylcytosine-specific restriction endonuclease McrA